MGENNWPRQRDMNGFYGNPDVNRDGVADLGWQQKNLVRLTPPYSLYYPRQVARNRIDKRAIKFKALTVHKLCAASLEQCLRGLQKEFSAEELYKYELDICGGVFNFRLMRSGQSLSIHSWGAAIDLSHLINHYRRRYNERLGMMPMRAVKVFKNEGWTWGGLWSTPDAMHFQAARI